MNCFESLQLPLDMIHSTAKKNTMSHLCAPIYSREEMKELTSRYLDGHLSRLMIARNLEVTV
jgi:hypothetical protein